MRLRDVAGGNRTIEIERTHFDRLADCSALQNRRSDVEKTQHRLSTRDGQHS
jgi:hypothetical protein